MTHLRLLVLVLLVLVISGTTPAARADITNSTQEERQFMDKAANTMLVSRTLNTLTTTCGGGCGADSPCVIVGSSSENRINCVNETRCTTFTNGMTALCMAPFNDNSDVWGFYPAKTNDTTGIAPFERVGLVQPSDGVRHVLFRRADDQFGPLNSALDVSSFNLQPPTVISSLLFDGIQLSGASDALPINSSLQLGIVNCQLKSIPTQMIMGSNIRELDLSRNAIATADSLRGVIFPSLAKFNLQYNQLASMELTAATFPMLEALELDFNNFPTIPEFIFDVPTLRNLSLTSNPVNASLLSDKQFEFLAQLETFAIDGVTPTEACPSDETIARLNSSFTFCINQVGSGSGSGSGSGTNVGDVELTPTPTTVVGESSGSSGSKAGLVVGIVVGVLALMAILAFVLWYCKRRRDKNRDTDPHKPTFTSMGSFIANGHALSKGRVVDDFTGDGGHYDAYVPLRSNPSSEQSSDSYPILGNISNDGPDGLSRLSYQDLYLHKLLRVSSRSELWLGEYFDETVVVKKIKVNTVSRAVMRDFVEEVKLMSTLKHPRIVEFRGALWDKSGTELCAVVEYIANGPLRNVTSSTQQNLSVPKQHAIARQIAEALAFLHSQTIVHGRLNAFNILLDQDYSAKLSLFSIFHYVRLSPLDYECAVFVAPEVQRGQQPTEKADVFAFGVVLVELNTGESPEQNRRRRASLQDSSPEANSPTAQRTGFTLSPQCSSMMKDLITACVERDPARRPSMAQIAMALRSTEVTM